MSPFTRASLFLISAAIAKLASAGTLQAFPQSGCDTGGYYITIEASNSACTKTYFEDNDFQEAGNSSGQYQAWISLTTSEADGCAVVVGSNSVDAAAPPCGECVDLVHTEGQCTLIDLPSPFYAWECCGQDCQDQCGQIPSKRTIGEAVEALQAREAKAQPTSPDIANLKNRSPVSSAPKAKRSDCSFTSSGNLYTQAGEPTKISDTFNTCTSSSGCMAMYSGTVESSFSQTFGVMESTEAGLFDIVSETISFSYSATWEQSQSVTVSGSYVFPEGQGGYLTFAPLSQCVDGTFAGADCSGMGIPTGGDARSACVPESINGGKSVNGDVNAVTSV